MEKNHLTYLLKFVLYIIILSIGLDRIVSIGLDKVSDKVYSGQNIGKLNQFLKIKDSVDFITFGSSRANHHINPLDFSTNGFNMGMDGRMIAYSATLLKLLPKKEQVVLFHIDPSNTFKNDYVGVDLDALNTKYFRNRIIKSEIDRYIDVNKFQLIYHSIVYNNRVLGIVKNIVIPKYNYCDYNGYDPISVSSTQKKIFLKILGKKPVIEKPKSEFIINPIYDSYLDEVKEFCERNNKTIVFFTAPVYDDKNIADNRTLKRIMKDKGLTYYDFSDHFKKPYNLSYWKDETHLSDIGANLFSKYFSDLLKNTHAVE